MQIDFSAVLEALKKAFNAFILIDGAPARVCSVMQSYEDTQAFYELDSICPERSGGKSQQEYTVSGFLIFRLAANSPGALAWQDSYAYQDAASHVEFLLLKHDLHRLDTRQTRHKVYQQEWACHFKAKVKLAKAAPTL